MNKKQTKKKRKEKKRKIEQTIIVIAAYLHSHEIELLMTILLICAIFSMNNSMLEQK
jgi:hypothetical protein